MKAAAHPAPIVARRAHVAIVQPWRPLIALAFEGLSEEQKELESVLGYDATGVALFERLCEQPEYYLGRAETLLVERHAGQISDWIGSQAAILEYGPRSTRRTSHLFGALHDPFAYLAIDVCEQQLERTCANLQRRYRALPIEGLCQDFSQCVTPPASLHRARRHVAYFGGSMLGSFGPLEAVELLSSIRETTGPDGGLLIGIDLLKQPPILERAYNDAAGVAAALNRNILARLNRELEGTFDLDAFQHRAVWNEAGQRIEISLVSLRAQMPCIAGIGVPLAASEAIRTNCAQKFTPEGFAALAHAAGWAVRHAWTEPQNQYSLLYLEGIE